MVTWKEDPGMTETQATGPTVLRMILGRQLRDLREKAGLDFDQAAEAALVSSHTIRRMEGSEGGLKPVTVRSALQAYGITDPAEIRAFTDLAKKASQPGWWHSYTDVLPGWMRTFVGLEEAASLIRGYEPHCVPGLLQTADYARAVIRTGFPTAKEEEIDRRVALRLARQEILDQPQPPRVWMVMDETALRRPAATVGPAVIRAQIDALIAMSERPAVTLQVMPLSAGLHPALGGLFCLLRFADDGLPDLVYSEALTSALYLDKPQEVAAYLETLDRISAQAAPAERTVRLLRGIRKEI
jgi:transcriptional regulator with XRE-family HTH domain